MTDDQRTVIWKSEGCTKCTRLWEEYSTQTHLVVKLEGKMEIARLARDEDQETILSPQLKEAERSKSYARGALLAHQTAEHPDQNSQKSLAENRGAVERELVRAIELARTEFLRIVREQQAVLTDVPSAIPHPDGVFRLKSLARMRSIQFEKYEQAKAELDGFLRGEKNP